MMTLEHRELIDRLNDASVREGNLEVEFRKILRDVDDTTRSEMAYYITDTLNAHPDLPAGFSVSLEKVEKYIGSNLRIADWRIKHDELWAEYDAIKQDMAFLVDLEDDDSD